jgi:hypothetical protein
MYQKVFYGQIHLEGNKSLRDIDRRERISLVPLVVMAVIMGVASPYWMKSIEPAVTSTLPQANAGTKPQAEKRGLAIPDPGKHGSAMATPNSTAGTIQNDSATGGQK